MERGSMGRNRRRAIAAGNVGIDISPVFTGEERTSIAEAFRPGEIVHIEGSEIYPGGGAANTGIAMNLFGIETTIVARIGDDYFGDMFLQMAKDYGAPTSLVKDRGTYTAYSIILAVPGMDRIILQNPGANDLFESGDIDPAVVAESHLFHFGHPPSMERMYEESGKELVKIFRRMQAEGLVTSLDMCAVDPMSPAGKVDWKAFLKNVLPHVDFFLPSQSELAYMLGKDGPVEELAKEAHLLGTGSVVIKMGAQGMYYRTGGGDMFRRVEDRLGYAEGTLDSWVNRQGIQAPHPVDREVSGLGAGDVSIAAFLSSLLHGCSLDESLYHAAVEGALCVTAYDAFSGLVPFGE